MADRPLVYIAGPYSKPDPVLNTRTAILAAEQIEEECDVDVFIPHLTMLWHLVSPAPIARWYARDMAILRRSDAVFRLKGKSNGADGEVRLAKELDIPVFERPQHLFKWRARLTD